MGPTSYTSNPPIQYRLTLNTNGAGVGSVTSDQPGFNCDYYAGCIKTSALFNSGTVVTMRATPAAGASFDSWNGCDTIAENICVVTMNADKTVTAIFGAYTGWMSITLTDNPDPVNVNSTLIYTLRVNNTYSFPIANILVVDILPPGVTFINAEGTGWNCNKSSGIITCSSSSALPTGASSPITISVTAPSMAGIITDVANLVAAYEPTGSVLSTAREDTTVTTPGTIIVRKVTIPAGDSQVFKFVAGETLSPNNFVLRDGESRTFSNVTPGSGYYVREPQILPDWYITNNGPDLRCSNGSISDNIHVSAGESVICTFVSHKIIFPNSGTITIKKETNPSRDPQRFNFESDNYDLMFLNLDNNGYSRYNQPIIIRAQLDGSSPVPLAYGTNNFSVASPDGTQFAFSNGSYDAPDPCSGVWIMNHDGSNKHPIECKVFDFYPHWSPDGTKLIGVGGSDTNNYQTRYGIYIVNADGSGFVEVTPDLSLSQQVVYIIGSTVLFTPDGNNILFNLAGSTGGGLDLYIMNIDGSNTRLLREGVALSDLSLDGKTVLVGILDSPTPPYVGIYKMNIDGSNLVRLMTGDAGRFSPDGKKIAFRCNEDVPGVHEDVCIANSDGTGILNVTENIHDLPYPNFMAQGFIKKPSLSGAISDGEQFSVINTAPGTYSSKEILPPGWVLSSIVCDDSNSTGDMQMATVAIHLEPSETVMCTFTNTKAASVPFIATKEAKNLTTGSKAIYKPGNMIEYTITLTNPSATTILQNLTLTDTITDLFLNPATGVDVSSDTIHCNYEHIHQTYTCYGSIPPLGTVIIKLNVRISGSITLWDIDRNECNQATVKFSSDGANETTVLTDDPTTTDIPNDPTCLNITKADKGTPLAGLKTYWLGSALYFEALDQGVKVINVQIFSLAGQRVYNSGWVKNGLMWKLIGTGGKSVGNGLYLYVVTVRGFDGKIVRTQIKKLVILR